MYRILGVAFLLAATILFQNAALAQSSGDGRGMSVTGAVLEVGDSILVEEESGGQYVLDITDDTEFLDGLTYASGSAPPRAPTAADLAPGLTVQVFTTGPVLESFPAQGEAATIVFLNEWYEADSPGDPGNDGGGKGGSGDAPSDYYTVLPDTGGMTTLVALAVFAVTAGISFAGVVISRR